MNIKYVEVSERRSELGGHFVRGFESLSPNANPVLSWHFMKKDDAIVVAKDLAQRHNATFFE